MPRSKSHTLDRYKRKQNFMRTPEPSGTGDEIVERLPDSVDSGRGVRDVAAGQPPVWESNREPSIATPHRRLSPETGERIRERRHASRITHHVASLPGAAKSDQPDWIAPQLATLVDHVPVGEWLHELKYDGYRILCRVRRGEARLYTRHANDWTAKLHAQAAAVSALGIKNAWLDGEVAVFTKEGKTDFQALQNAFDTNFTGRIVYCLFDLLHLEGYDLRSTPLVEHTRLLSSLLSKTASDRDGLLRYSDHIAGRGEAVFAEACRRGLGGLIAKHGSRNGPTKASCGSRAFTGLRADKAAKEVVKEQPRAASTNSGSRASGEQRPAVKTSEVVRDHVRLTNPDRVLYPDLGLTKAQLARYYEQVADRILPHLRGRPLTLVRCPEGYQHCFYQKHVNERVPQTIARVEIEEDGGRALYMVADRLEAVLGLVQMGVLELHTWGATRDQLDRPDRLTFDLDPDPTVPWTQVIEAARLTKTLLEELGLAPFLKTTGGKGLHVVVPIQRFDGWETVKDFAKAVADHMVRTMPQRFTSNMAKRARKGKIFIDYLRNARGATAIAAYSPRARPGAPVPVPLAWEELSPELTSDQFTIMNLPDRLARQRTDPWQGYQRAARRLTSDMRERLTESVKR